MQRTPELSIIVPCYNEGEKLLQTIPKTIEFLSTHYQSVQYEIILVDDGSTDGLTRGAIEFLQDSNEVVLAQGYATNRGKGAAIQLGILNSRGATVLFMDADLSTDLHAIHRVFELKECVPVIIGSRRHPDSQLLQSQGIIRRFIGSCASVITNCLVPLRIPDTQCGFKAFDGAFIRQVAEHQKIFGFAFDVEYLYEAKKAGLRIESIPVIWENDSDSKVSITSSSIRFFLDLFRIR